MIANEAKTSAKIASEAKATNRTPKRSASQPNTGAKNAANMPYMVIPTLISVRLQPNSCCNGSIKKPIVLKGSGEAPNAVPSKEAINTFHPNLNSLVEAGVSRLELAVVIGCRSK